MPNTSRRRRAPARGGCTGRVSGDNSRVPNLKPLFSASNTVGQVLEQGDYVVFESTVYPGCTEEDCLPILEKLSGLQLGKDFKIGYSPERINPGDKERTIEKIVKVVSGSDDHALNVISDVYKLIIDAGIKSNAVSLPSKINTSSYVL